MVQLARAIQARDYETARTIHVDIMTHRNDECGNWMVCRLPVLFGWVYFANSSPL
jgi:protein transport protein SEC31